MAELNLKRQLEMARFQRAFEVTESLAEHRSLLTTVELERINAILIGSKFTDVDPWRQGPATLNLPSGKVETLALISDPKKIAREKLHLATELGENGKPIDGAIEIYVGLILSHVFQDANRRTAALACHYFLKRYGVPLSGLAIHEIGIGDLRETDELGSFRETIHQMAKFASKRKK